MAFNFMRQFWWKGGVIGPDVYLKINFTTLEPKLFFQLWLQLS
jgi:hypothetical protein